jgi:hypothetical protein
MNYRVGQRVKVVNAISGWAWQNGCAGTVEFTCGGDAYGVRLDGYTNPNPNSGGGCYGCFHYELSPLSDPDSEWAHEALRKLLDITLKEKLPLTDEQLEDVR